MNPTVKSMILKAQDNLETAKKYLDDGEQHDIVGYNLAQACEFYLKALCVLRNVAYANEDAHDLDALMRALEESNFSAISSHADVIELTPYNSPQARIEDDERLDMKEYYGHVEDLKKFVGEYAFS